MTNQRLLFVLMILPFTLLFSKETHSQVQLFKTDSIQLFPGIIVVPVNGDQRNAGLQETRMQRLNLSSDQEIKNWINRYNSLNNSRYQYAGRSIVPSAILLATPEQLNQLRQQAKKMSLPLIDSNKAASPYTLSQYTYDTSRERQFFNDGTYKYPLKQGKDYLPNTYIKFPYGYSNAIPKKPGALNGNVYIRFFRDTTLEIAAYYGGEMKNGQPNGYGVFIARNDKSIQGEVRKGFWKNGSFVHQKHVQLLTDSIARLILQNESFANLKTTVLEATYNKDPILPETENGYSLVIRYDWQDGNKKRFLCVAVSHQNYFDRVTIPLIEVVQKDGFDELFFVSRLMLNRQSALINTDVSQSIKTLQDISTTRIDEYMELTVTGARDCNQAYDVVGKVKGSNICREINIFVRNTRSEQWRNVGSITTLLYHSGQGAYDPPSNYGTLTATPVLGHSFTGKYKTVAEIMEEITPVVKAQYPSPSGDNSVEPETTGNNSVAKTRMNALVQKLMDSRLFAFTPNDTLTGIWTQNENILIVDMKQKKAYTILARNLAMNAPYQDMVTEYDIYKEGNTLFLTVSGNYFKTATKSSVIYRITGISRNKVSFTAGSEWVRIE